MKPLVPRASPIVCGAVLACLACACGLDPCLADGDRCDGEPSITLDPCSGTGDAITLSALLAAPPDAGTQVAVFGPLARESGMCTQLGCATGGCCNSCGAGMLLTERETPGLPTPEDLTLSGPVDDIALACGGDESLICCPLPADGRVVLVRGELYAAGATTAGELYGVRLESICELGAR